jgi:hypothetical protein
MKIIITGISELSEKLLQKDSIQYLQSLIGTDAQMMVSESMIIAHDGRLIDVGYLEFEYL